MEIGSFAEAEQALSDLLEIAKVLLEMVDARIENQAFESDCVKLMETFFELHKVLFSLFFSLLFKDLDCFRCC